jgi:predicted metal-binding transcription factor (methanogenesis marker protein 9)
MDLHLSRGRVLQLTEQYKAALQEYRSCVTISKGKFFRDAAIECIKVQLADTQYAAAHKSLVEFITNEVPDADRRFPEIHELIQSDRRLAMLLMLANAGIDQMRNAGVWAPSLTIAYEVLDNGLVVKPPPIRESELHLKRNPKDYTIIADRLAKVESENAEWTKNQSLIELKDKVHACLHKYQAILEASTAEMARIEEELKEKAAAAEKAKNMPAIPRGGGGGRLRHGRGRRF